MLKEAITRSELMLTALVAQNGAPKERLEIPNISEVFSLFFKHLNQHPELKLEDLKDLPASIKDYKKGLYRKGNELVLVEEVPPGIFKYIALYCGSLLAKNNRLAEQLTGLYVLKLVPAQDPDYYTPFAFSYLIKDDFYRAHNYKNIVPLHVLPSLTPDELESMWVYLAMRQFNREFDDRVPYQYLIESEDEALLVAEYDLL